MRGTYALWFVSYDMLSQTCLEKSVADLRVANANAFERLACACIKMKPQKVHLGISLLHRAFAETKCHQDDHCNSSVGELVSRIFVRTQIGCSPATSEQAMLKKYVNMKKSGTLHCAKLQNISPAMSAKHSLPNYAARTAALCRSAA